LAGLSKLELLTLGIDLDGDPMLRSLEGISPVVMHFSIAFAPHLVSLAGIEGCTSMESLSLRRCGVSSLQPLRGLSSLERLAVSRCLLTSLEGLNSMQLQYMSLHNCSLLRHLAGLEHLSALKSLVVEHCGVTSLQPLSQLGEGLQQLSVVGCREVQEEVLELPHVQPNIDVVVTGSNVREVVLAEGVRLACNS
jgi:Leucine-rich repeat (LRR) protein